MPYLLIFLYHSISMSKLPLQNSHKGLTNTYYSCRRVSYIVLNALWETDGAELGTIVNILFPHTGWNRNTVLTYLTRMEAKGLVSITNQHEVGLWSNSYFDTTAKPNAEFSDAVRSQSMNCMYVGDDSDKDSINHIAVSMAPVFQGESRPVQLRNPSQELNRNF